MSAREAWAHYHESEDWIAIVAELTRQAWRIIEEYRDSPATPPDACTFGTVIAWGLFTNAPREDESTLDWLIRVIETLHPAYQRALAQPQPAADHDEDAAAPREVEP
jgi:hypothetical protein